MLNFGIDQGPRSQGRERKREDPGNEVGFHIFRIEDLRCVSRKFDKDFSNQFISVGGVF